MSESPLGVSVTAARQNAGRSAYGLRPSPPRRPPSGGKNFPDVTISARVTVASLSAAFARLSHVAADADEAFAAGRSAPNSMTSNAAGFMDRSPGRLTSHGARSARIVALIVDANVRDRLSRRGRRAGLAELAPRRRRA